MTTQKPEEYKRVLIPDLKVDIWKYFKTDTLARDSARMIYHHIKPTLDRNGSVGLKFNGVRSFSPDFWDVFCYFLYTNFSHNFLCKNLYTRGLSDKNLELLRTAIQKASKSLTKEGSLCTCQTTI